MLLLLLPSFVDNIYLRHFLSYLPFSEYFQVTSARVTLIRNREKERQGTCHMMIIRWNQLRGVAKKKGGKRKYYVSECVIYAIAAESTKFLTSLSSPFFSSDVIRSSTLFSLEHFPSWHHLLNLLRPIIWELSLFRTNVNVCRLSNLLCFCLFLRSSFFFFFCLSFSSPVLLFCVPPAVLGSKRRNWGLIQ